MALPTIQYDYISPSTNGTVISAWMPKFQTLLFNAGWTIEYADSAAIGTGSASVPAWDATITANTDAGVAIYQMPANGFTRRWFVRLAPGWPASTTLQYMRVQIGTGQTSGTLTNAGNLIRWETTGGVNSSEMLLSVSEDGMFFYNASNATAPYRWVLIERARSFAGVVGEDLIVAGHTSTGFITGQATPYGCKRYRASDGFEYVAGRYFLLGTLSNPAGFNQPGIGGVTTTSADGETNLPLGPVFNSGVWAGLPRLMTMLAADDIVANTDHPVFVDGSVKLYRMSNAVMASAVQVLTARE